MQITMETKDEMPSFGAQENDIMYRFNFERVLQVMHAINWRWLGQEVTMSDLKRTALQLMDTAVRNYQEGNSSWTSVSTGGFTARVDELDYGPRLSLSFSIEQAEGRRIW